MGLNDLVADSFLFDVFVFVCFSLLRDSHISLNRTVSTVDLHNFTPQEVSLHGLCLKGPT